MNVLPISKAADATSYIVASCKPWHWDGFERIRNKFPEASWIYVSTPTELEQALESNKPRYIFFLHWSWRVPHEIWANYECVCFHMTDLPYGRGGSPLQNLILAGKTETMLTALRMVEEIDAGPIYTKRSMSLAGRAEEIYNRAGELCWEIIGWMIETNPQPVPQTGEVTYFKRRRPEQSVLPKEGDLATLYDHIRMLDAPTYPLAFIEYGPFRLEFSNAEMAKDGLHARVRIFLPEKGCS